MKIEINTKEDLIQFIESNELTTNQVNELLQTASIHCLFIYDHAPKERARLLREMFKRKELRVFIDIG
jgi:hypothetical protein